MVSKCRQGTKSVGGGEERVLAVVEKRGKSISGI